MFTHFIFKDFLSVEWTNSMEAMSTESTKILTEVIGNGLSSHNLV